MVQKASHSIFCEIALKMASLLLSFQKLFGHRRHCFKDIASLTHKNVKKSLYVL